MARGAPDYSNVRKEQVFSGVSDLGEVAARLGSPLTLDRRGEFIHFYGFEDGFNRLKTTYSGVGTKLQLSTNRVFQGKYSLNQYYESNNANSEIFVYVPWSDPSYYGIETHLSVDVGNIRLTLQIKIWDGSYVRLFGMQYEVDTTILSVIDSTGYYVDTGERPKFWISDYVFHFVKLVIDGSSGSYVRAMFNSQVIDLSAYGVSKGVNTSEPRMEFRLETSAKGSVPQNVYIDGYVITRNE